MNGQIKLAVSVLRRFPNKEDTELHSTLVDAGINRGVAARLVEFLPMAYCRVMLSGSGATFANTFQRRLPDGGLSSKKPLSIEPLWCEVLDFASEEVARGISGEELLAVASRSAEFSAANQLLNKGSKLKNVVFTPVIFPWDEDGPDIPFHR